MKKQPDNGILYAPSDLVTYLESPFASWMQRMFVEGVTGIVPDEESADQKLVQREGDQHEVRHLAKLRAAGCDVAEIEPFGERSAEETVAAIEAQREVVFQARLERGAFSGMADFLVLGARGHSGRRFYEVQDTKLASRAKPYHIIQLCCYAEMLEAITGYLTPTITVILGNGDVRTFRTEDFHSYYQRVKAGFLGLMSRFDPDLEPPVPDARADHGRWQSHADKWLDARDHLVRVAGITAGQIRKLEAAGIATLEALATSTTPRVPQLGADTLAKLKRQARAQWKTRQQAREATDGAPPVPWHEVIPPPAWDPRRGLGMLPPASSGDVFFDIEGYPLVEGGLEYLLGASCVDDGTLKFADWWAHDRAGEKASFEGFIDWVFARWQADPAMHIYHYAPYEITALRKLMGRHATREEHLDTLLRREVFVDLYRVVRDGIVFGEDSYSIKKVEKLYAKSRQADVKNAASSIVFYAEWMGSGEPRDWQDSPLLGKIRDYNEEDCVSTLELANWLWEKQRQNGIAWSRDALQRERQAAPAEVQSVNEDEARRQAMADRMLADATVAEARGDAGADWGVHRLLAQLLNFHRREEKPVLWAMFDRLDQTTEELTEDVNCLGGITRTDTPPIGIKRSKGLEFRFDPNQDTKIREGTQVKVRENRSIEGTVETFDPEGLLVVKFGPKALQLMEQEPLPGVISLIPDEHVRADSLKQSIERLAGLWCGQRMLPAALKKLFLRQGPGCGIQDRRDGETLLDTSLRIVQAMDGDTLVIQGPPGTGKTYTASHVIAELLRCGRNVGVVSNSHKAILNLLGATADAMGTGLEGVRCGSEVDEELADRAPRVRQVKDSKPCAEAYRCGLIAGTAWLFSLEEMTGKLDYLFIDEAGQVSLANLTAMAPSARNLVLLGDQMQLGQPIQGTHPGDSGRSTLDYLLNGHAVVPPHLGIFLDETRRLHPGICAFISSAVYEGRLHPHPSTGKHILRRAGGAAGGRIPVDSGIWFSPVEHDGNTQASEEEIARILEITGELLGREYLGRKGEGRLEIGDILFVAPYNMQVRLLQERLPEGARVGSVDKFQGQEAPVVVYSLCSSAGDYGSRGLRFILDRNRLNVAISRAQSLAVVVGDPRIARAAASTVEDMARVNLYCKLLELGGTAAG